MSELSEGPSFIVGHTLGYIILNAILPCYLFVVNGYHTIRIAATHTEIKLLPYIISRPSIYIYMSRTYTYPPHTQLFNFKYLFMYVLQGQIEK